MADVVSRRSVAFAGDGCGEDELSWGQADVWTKMVTMGHALALGGTRALPEGTSLADVESELRYLMHRYQTLRTRLAFDATGWPRQIVHDRSSIELEVVDVAAGDPAQVAAHIEARYRSDPFDYTREWPLRMAVVRRAERCEHLTLIVSHLAMDGAGALLMMRETAARNTRASSASQPLEQARSQALPAARRQNAAALRHWETHLRALPDPAVAPSRDPRRPRRWTGLFRSTALPRALHAAARREGMDSAPALLAVFALAFARVAGPAVLPLRLVVSNRFRPGLAESVGPVSQPGLCVIDTTGGDFPAVLRRAHGAALAAYKHAYYDRRDLDRVVAAVVAERGPQFNLDVSLNDRRFGGTLQDVAAPEESSFAWLSRADGRSSAFFVNVDGSEAALEITLFLDTHFMAPDDGAAVLWAMEEIAVGAAAGQPMQYPASSHAATSSTSDGAPSARPLP
jgi:hypothetical protein